MSCWSSCAFVFFQIIKCSVFNSKLRMKIGIVELELKKSILDFLQKLLFRTHHRPCVRFTQNMTCIIKSIVISDSGLRQDAKTFEVGGATFTKVSVTLEWNELNLWANYKNWGVWPPNSAITGKKNWEMVGTTVIVKNIYNCSNLLKMLEPR